MSLDVLVVDDSAAIRRILQRVLRQTDLPVGQVYEAGDGCEALRTLQDRTIGRVLADINMPKMDGIQLLGRIRACPEWNTWVGTGSLCCSPSLACKLSSHLLMSEMRGRKPQTRKCSMRSPN
jgi:CheY-like chemotaxis protein